MERPTDRQPFLLKPCLGQGETTGPRFISHEKQWGSRHCRREASKVSMMTVPWLSPCIKDTEPTVWGDQDWWEPRELETLPRGRHQGKGLQCTALQCSRTPGTGSLTSGVGTPQTRHMS